jgi:glycosyltransferase involved in cell wall biosynthesis
MAELAARTFGYLFSSAGFYSGLIDNFMIDNRMIAILTYYHYPCHHPVLTNIFAKELAKNNQVVWLLQGDVTKGRIKRWHNSIVLLSRGMLKKCVSAFFYNNLMRACVLGNLFSLLVKRKIRIVLLRDLPFTTIILLPLRKRFDFKVYYQYSAPLGDMSIHYYRSTRTMKRYWYLISGIWQKGLTENAVKRSDMVFPISDFHKQQLERLTGAEKLIPITMGVDTDLIFNQCDPIPHLNEIKKSNKLIAYFGTLNIGRNPEFLLNVLSEVKRQIPHCKLVLMGKTIHRWEDRMLKDRCAELGLSDDVIFTGHLEKSILTNYLKQCDLSVSPIPPLKHFIISSPTKVYESLGCGVPVVGNCEILEQAKVISASGGGLLAKYETQAFSQAIVRLLDNDDQRQAMGRSGRAYVLENYDYKKMARTLLRYF